MPVIANEPGPLSVLTVLTDAERGVAPGRRQGAPWAQGGEAPEDAPEAQEDHATAEDAPEAREDHGAAADASWAPEVLRAS